MSGPTIPILISHKPGCASWCVEIMVSRPSAGGTGTPELAALIASAEVIRIVLIYQSSRVWSLEYPFNKFISWARSYN